jgi:hypothetical protein
VPVAAAAVPAGAPTALAGAFAVRATSSTDRPAAVAPAGTCSSVASTALGNGGGGFHLLGGPPPSLSSSSSSSDDEFFRVAGGESPYCSRSRYSSSCYSRCSRRRILFSFLRAAFSCSRRYAARAAAQSWVVGGSDREASTVTLC